MVGGGGGEIRIITGTRPQDHGRKKEERAKTPTVNPGLECAYAKTVMNGYNEEVKYSRYSREF